MPVIRRLVLAYSARSRRRKAKAIREFAGDELDTLLLCGAISTGEQPNEGIVERGVATSARRVFAFNVELPEHPQRWPFVVADGRAMSFASGSVDLLVSNAVIEHVGGAAEQADFVAEHCRVARRWVITTPNRWFPVESHTSTVFRHYSPAWRAAVPQSVFTRLLSLAEFRQLLPREATVVGHWWSPTFTAYYTAPSPTPEPLHPGSEHADAVLPPSAPQSV